jgi:hypothetical protein
MSWTNADGLYVKFGSEEAIVARGGEQQSFDGRHIIEFYIDYTDALSATAAVLGDASGNTTGAGAFGVVIPKNLLIEEVQVYAETAFTSSGTVGSADLTFGTVRATDRSTAIDVDGLSTIAGSVIDALGETTVLRKGGTGAGALIGTNASATYDGVIVVANTAHASHPFTAGRARVRVVGHYGTTH